jgi:murein endopeptidase
MESSSVTLLIVFSILGAAQAGVDYCKISPVHIACNHTGQFSVNCSSGAAVIPFNATHIQTIVDGHNKYRNSIAGGEIKPFKTATKMKAVVSC